MRRELAVAHCTRFCYFCFLLSIFCFSSCFHSLVSGFATATPSPARENLGCFVLCTLVFPLPRHRLRRCHSLSGEGDLICSVLCYLFSVLCTLYSVLCSLYSVLCSLYSVLCTLFSVLCSLYSVLCTLFSVLCTLFSVLCTLFSVICYLFSVICSLFSIARTCTYKFKPLLIRYEIN